MLRRSRPSSLLILPGQTSLPSLPSNQSVDQPSTRESHAETPMTGTRKVWKYLIKIGIFGLGMASTLAGYKNNSIPVTVCGAAAMLGSLMSSLITQLSRARALGAQNDHLRELEGQTAQTQVDVATVTSTTESLSPGDSLFLHHHAPTRDLYPPQSNMDRHNIIDPDFEDVLPLYSRPRLPIPPTSSSSLSLTGVSLKKVLFKLTRIGGKEVWKRKLIYGWKGPWCRKEPNIGNSELRFLLPFCFVLFVPPANTVPRETSTSQMPTKYIFAPEWDQISEVWKSSFSIPVSSAASYSPRLLSPGRPRPKCSLGPSSTSPIMVQSETKYLALGEPLSPSPSLRPLPIPPVYPGSKRNLNSLSTHDDHHVLHHNTPAAAWIQHPKCTPSPSSSIMAQSGTKSLELGDLLSSSPLLHPPPTPPDYCSQRNVSSTSAYDSYPEGVPRQDPPAYSAKVQFPERTPNPSSLISICQSLRPAEASPSMEASNFDWSNNNNENNTSIASKRTWEKIRLRGQGKTIIKGIREKIRRGTTRRPRRETMLTIEI
ncbi:hypothetical protein BDP27DRAFT_1408894 [Rhodocollybia butyracea]|uniref:Uncharacterized protein n=1 Tax=Rhodocollybia butyracea TaxID=206335 RepID=A0A9P5TVW8_9AGAR|nr:hypothetical protein BDP27DRAFT_1408894 [Rhodocollybia butyracea]